MLQENTTRILLTAILGILLLASTAAATVTVDTSTDSMGGQEGNSLAIETTYTVSPDENRATDIRIAVRPTTNSFVDYTSFERTVNPGDADVEIQNVGEGEFEIESLEPDQEITLTFDVYPKTIQQRELDVAIVTFEYVQQGQSLENTARVTADLSDSAWFQLQDAEDNSDGGNGGLNLLFGLLVGIGVGAITVYIVINELL